MTMATLSVLPLPYKFPDSDDFTFVSAKFDRDFSFKLKIDHHDEKFEEEEKKEQEFSFACTNPQTSLVTADEIFDNGQIRPIFPVFDQSTVFAAAHGGAASPLLPPLKKLFVEQQRDVFSSGSETNGAPEGPLRESSHETTTLEVEVKDSRGTCEKSNSTGFSKLWRFRRELKLRSNSDGKDAFVFLNPPEPAKPEKPGEAKVKNDAVKKGKAGETKVKNDVVKNGKAKEAEAKAKNDVVKHGKVGMRKTMSSSAHEKLYVMNRKRKESDKRRSFLPYRNQLVGFFANMNAFSRNVHPF